MKGDFRAALARAQSDYEFYVQLHRDPATALAGWSLDPDERATLLDPQRLAEALQRRRATGRPAITIKISGSHDWVNRAAPQREDEVSEMVAHEVAAVQRAENEDERRESTLRLIQLIG